MKKEVKENVLLLVDFDTKEGTIDYIEGTITTIEDDGDIITGI